LLKALSQWGERALEELDGMFVIAFYDARNRRVLLARDHLGIKPLYVATSQGKVVFASEIQAVLASGLVSKELDPAGIATMLAYGSPQDPLTVLKDVRSFPPGSFCWFTAESAMSQEPPTPKYYWNFSPVSAPVSERDALEKIRSLLDSAVRDQILSDVPLGVFLSAGIDSGTLVALAHRLSPSLRTHCVGFASVTEIEEREAAAATAAMIGSHHSETVLTDANVKTFWHQWLDAADRPGVDGLNTYIVCASIKQAGITVALSGGGADEIFGGYSHFQRIPALYQRLRHFAALPSAFRRSLAYAAGSLSSRNRRERAMDLVSHLDSPLDVLLWNRRIFSNSQLADFGVRPNDLGLSPHYLPLAEQQRLMRMPTSTPSNRCHGRNAASISPTRCCATWTSTAWLIRSRCACRFSRGDSWSIPPACLEACISRRKGPPNTSCGKSDGICSPRVSSPARRPAFVSRSLSGCWGPTMTSAQRQSTRSPPARCSMPARSAPCGTIS